VRPEDQAVPALLWTGSSTQAVDPDWSPRRPASPPTASAPGPSHGPQHHHLTRRERLTLRVEGSDTGMRLILVVTR
jgi:hypothetical protein